VPSVAPSAVASSLHSDAVRKVAAKSERAETPFELLLEAQPDPTVEVAPVRGDDRASPQPTRCEPAAADRSAGLTNSKPTDARQARAIPAKDSDADETDAATGQDPVDPDADDIEADVDATLLADVGSSTTAATDPAVATAANSPASSTTPAAVVMPVTPDFTAVAIVPTSSDGEATAISPTLTPAVAVTPAVAAAAESQDTGTKAALSAALAADAADPADPAVRAATAPTQPPEQGSVAAQIPEFISQAKAADANAAATPASPAVAATPADPQAGTAASPAIAAMPASPAHEVRSGLADAQDPARPSSGLPADAGAPNKPDDGAAPPVAPEPAAARPSRTTVTAKSGETPPSGSEQTARAPEAARAAGAANPADQAPGSHASATAAVSSEAAKAADGESKPAAAQQHDLHEAVETLASPPSASDSRPAGTALLAAGHEAAGSDPARSGQASAPANAGAPPAANVGTTAPTNAPYAMASSAPVPISGLAVELVARVRDGKNRFEIRLDPPELGRIDVHLKVDRDGNVTSRLVVERSETLDLLRRDAPSLERALHNAGLKTGEQGLEFSLRNQAFDRDQGGRNESGASRLIIPDEIQPSAPAAASYGRRLGIGGGVDIRV